MHGEHVKMPLKASTLAGSSPYARGAPARRGIVTASVVGQLITPSTVKPAKNDRSRANQLTGEVSE
mgnify:CR=1 FL=1